MITLVNRSSASASEIVSGALQDHDRSLVIGETTFGKALVQSVYRLSRGAAALITTARYYTPSGRLIQRPWDGTFDDYLTYTLRDQDANKTHKAEDLKYTDAGRKVYSGGGVEPDRRFDGPTEGFNPGRFARTISARGLFDVYARRFTRQGDTRVTLTSSGPRHEVAAGYQVTDEMLNEFKQLVHADADAVRRGGLAEGPAVHRGDDAEGDRPRSLRRGTGVREAREAGPAAAVRAQLLRRGGAAAEHRQELDSHARRAQLVLNLSFVPATRLPDHAAKTGRFTAASASDPPAAADRRPSA